MQQTRVIAPMGKAFVAIATIEAFTWAGLLIGMYLKYGSGTTDAGVWRFGRLHGLAFITYIVIAVMAGHRLRWSLWAMLAAIIAAIPPLATLPLEWWFKRRGLLSAAPE